MAAKLSERSWSIPLWLAIPAIGALWVSSWISTLDSTGSFNDAYVVWSVTAFATAWLLIRLIRSV